MVHENVLLSHTISLKNGEPKHLYRIAKVGYIYKIYVIYTAQLKICGSKHENYIIVTVIYYVVRYVL